LIEDYFGSPPEQRIEMDELLSEFLSETSENNFMFDGVNVLVGQRRVDV